MRYWIWWNDLIQGPFEFEELVLLRAFSEDLLVCMEDRADWLPASRVADLSSAIEQLRSRRAAPLTPPPPPPKRPPTVTPLQGEFFAEPPDQQILLESEDGPKGPYAYRSLTSQTQETLPYFIGQATMPFHFLQQPQTNTAVIEMPRPQPTRVTYPMPPVIKESPIPKPEVEHEPEQAPERVSLRVLHEEMPVEPVKQVVRVEPIEQIEPAERMEPAVAAEITPSMAPSLAEPVFAEKKPSWLLWILGIVLSVGLLVSAGYWIMDRVSTRSAIVEANRLESPKAVSLPSRSPLVVSSRATPTTPAVSPVPVAPSRTQRAFKKISPAIHRTSKKMMKMVRPHRSSPPPTPAVIPAVVAPVVVPPPPPPSPPLEPSPVSPPPAKASLPDRWMGKQNDAINLVMGKIIPGGKVTIGNHARAMLQEMHEKEMLHAAEVGERLYLPDKIVWAALREEDARYRVYLNFVSMQPSGERVQTRSYQFLVELDRQNVRTDDASTQQDLLTPPTGPAFKHNPMAVDIESILGGVDHYNKQKMRSMIVKNNRRNKNEQKNISASLVAAKEKVLRAAVFFRRAYTDKALENVAKAYEFSDLLKG